MRFRRFIALADGGFGGPKPDPKLEEDRVNCFRSAGDRPRLKFLFSRLRNRIERALPQFRSRFVDRAFSCSGSGAPFNYGASRQSLQCGGCHNLVQDAAPTKIFRFVALGDMGTGGKGQLDTASQTATYHDKSPFDTALLLGEVEE